MTHMRKRKLWTICLTLALFATPISSQGEENAANQPEVVEAVPVDETPVNGEVSGVDESPEANIQSIPETVDETAEDESTTPVVPVPVAQSDLVLPSQLDLRTAQQVAVRDNPSINAAEMRVAQAQQRVRQAMAAYFPSIDFSAGITKTWLAENDFRAAKNAPFQGVLNQLGSSVQLLFQANNPNAASFLPNTATSILDAFTQRREVENSFTTYSVRLTGTWLLFDGFEREFTHAASRFARKETSAAHMEAQRIILLAVAQSFYDAQLAREEIEIARADEAFNLRQLEEAKARRRVGAGSLSDVLNFEVRVNAARSALFFNELNYATARIGLAALMALPEANLPDTITLVPLGPEQGEEMLAPEVEEQVQLALDLRPDLNQSRYAVDRTRAQVGARRGVFYPAVGLTAGKVALKVDDNDIGPDDYETSLGINVSYNLFRGGGDLARLREAKAVHKEAQYLRDQSELDAAADVRAAAVQLETAVKQLWLQRANAQFVRRNRELVEKEFDAGQASLVRLNEAQRDLISAEGNLALARVSLRRAWQNLFAATGQNISGMDLPAPLEEDASQTDE